jgi:drug/metabolite transporter (DMT)-like permease
MVSVIGGSETAGFLIAVAAAACYDTGYALQALEARRAPRRYAMRVSLLGHLFTRRRWLAATALSLLGFPLQVWALTKAPITLVQPTLALGLLLLLVLGRRILREPVGVREIVAVLVIIASVAVTAAAAPSEPGEVPRDAGLVVALALLAGIAALPFALSRLGRHPVVLLVAGAGAADGLAGFAAKLVAEDASAGLWLAVVAWVALIGAVVAMGLVSESTALQRAPATRVAPTVLAMQIAIPVAFAPLVGGESWGSTPLGGAVLVVAMLGVVAGVGLLASSPAVAGVIAEAESEPGPAEPARVSGLQDQ